MLAVIAMICFILALFDVTLGTLDLVVLGFVFVAAHLAFGVPLTFWRQRGARR